MALRNQPYIPLYVQDYLTDEKLNECSPATQGVYIKLLCVLHKMDEYGTILLKQNDKQTSNQIKNFACKFAKQIAFSVEIIESALNELIANGVMTITGDILFQKRMVKDNGISVVRAKAGKKGGEKTQFAYKFAKAKPQANPENENENENENINNIKKDKFQKPTLKEITSYCLERQNKINPQVFIDYYTSNGWRVGRNPMKDWKAAIRTWEKNNFEGSNGNGTNQRSYKRNQERELPPNIAEAADAITRDYLAKKAKRATGGS